MRLPVSAALRYRLLLLLLFAAWLLVPGHSTARQQAGSSLPPDLAAFAEKGQALLKAGDNEGLRALAVTPETLGWLGTRSRRARTPGWSVHVLPLPAKADREGKAGGYLAVFSDFHTCESIGDHAHRLLQTPEGWRFGPEIPETDPLGYRVRDHRLTVRYDLPNAACFLTDEVTVERTGAEAGPCLLRLSADMTVDSVTRGGKPYPARSVPGLIAFLPPAERTFTLNLTYHGTVNHPGSDYIRSTEAVLVSYWYPHIGRLPAKHTVTVTVPKGWTVIGEGELQKREEGRHATVFTYRNATPTCYFSLDAGPYVMTTREVGGRRITACQLRANPDRANRGLDRVARALPFFEKAFGPFPYTHYELVETLGPFGGALEAYSFATFGGGDFAGAAVHELSHTWWGGVVPCPYTKSMWNESFASYADGLFNRQTGETVPPRALNGMHATNDRGRINLRAFAVPMAEAFDTENGLHSAVGYGKGSLVLAMLEDLLGTETMLRCMRRFRNDLRPGEAADWPDFERAVQKVTGRDYGWFFAQWVQRGGVPVVRVAEAKAAREGSGYVVTARITQEGAPYRLPRAPVALEMEGGVMVRQEVEIAGAETILRLRCAAPPRVLRLDPDGNILMAGAEAATGQADPFEARFE